MIDLLNTWDHELMLLMNGDGGVFWDQLWYIYSGKFTWIPLYALLLWLMYRYCKKNTTIALWRHLAICVFCTVLLIVISDQLASGLIKPLVCRPRPSHEPGLMDMLHYVNDYHGGMYGFVSSHASNSLATALWLGWLLFDRKEQHSGIITPKYKYARTFQILLIVWALLNCYSRIYLGVHYPGDILGGLIIGYLAFLIVRWIYIYICKRISTSTLSF